MKGKLIKATFTFTFTLAALSCFIFPSAAEITRTGYVNWIEISDREADITGIQFDLRTFVRGLDNAGEGYYIFAFTAEGAEPENAPAYKILTADGISNELRHRRFTDRQPVQGEVTKVTFWDRFRGEDNTPTAGMIPADFITEAADFEQKLLFNTQDDRHSFIVKEIVVTRVINDIHTEVYRMTQDPAVQNPMLGSVFTGGSLGLEPSTRARFRITAGDITLEEAAARAAVQADYSGTEAPGETVPDEEPEPAPGVTSPIPAADQAPESVSVLFIGLIIGVAVLIAGAGVWAVILSKKPN
jgi:hypothetical protein